MTIFQISIRVYCEVKFVCVPLFVEVCVLKFCSVLIKMMLFCFRND